MNDSAPTPDETRPLAATPGAYPPPPPTDPTVDPAAVPPPPAGATVAADTAVVPPPPPTTGRRARVDGPDDRGPDDGRSGPAGALTAIGTGLLAAAITISTTRARAEGDLDWSVYVIGLGATAIALLIAVLAAVAIRARHNPSGRGALVTWPGVVGILGAALMTGIGLADTDGVQDVLAYLIGAGIVVLAAVGYLASRRAAFVVTAIAGLALMYAQLYEDIGSDLGGDDDRVVIGAIAITAFVVVVTAVGWLLPTRAISGVAVGVVGIVGLVGILGSLLLERFFGMLFLGFGEMDGFGPAEAPPSYDAEVWTVLGLSALLVAMWAAAAALTGHSGFTIAAIALPAIVVPMALMLLVVEHPTWWGAAVAAVGGVLLAAAGVLARKRDKHVSGDVL